MNSKTFTLPFHLANKEYFTRFKVALFLFEYRKMNREPIAQENGKKKSIRIPFSDEEQILFDKNLKESNLTPHELLILILTDIHNNKRRYHLA